MQFDFDDNRYSAPTEVDMDYAMTIDDVMAMKAGLPIPKRVGIQRNLITGEIVDYNAGLVFNPTTGRVLQVLPDGKRQIVPKSDNRYGWMVGGVDRLLNPQSKPTLQLPDYPTSVNYPIVETVNDGKFYVQQGNQFRPATAEDYVRPIVESNPNVIQNKDYIWKSRGAEGLGKQIASGIPLWTADEIYRAKRESRQPAFDAAAYGATDGTDRFFGDSTYSRKRNRARPYGRDINMGYSPQFAQQNQSYSPDVMSRVGQGGVLGNYGTVMLPGANPEMIVDENLKPILDKNGNLQYKARWSNYPGDERPTTLVYDNKGQGVVVPSISIPGSGQKNLIPISQIDKNTMSPAQRRLLEDIPTPQYATNDQLSQWVVGKVKVGEDTTIRPLENKPGSFQTNYRSTYVDARTGDVYNVTSDKTGNFHLIRPEISEESYNFPTYKQTTNLTQEMIGINQGMKIGGNETITDIIREDPSIPGLDYFSEPVVAGLNPITGRPEIKYIHKGNLVNPFTELPEKILPGEDYSQYAVLDKYGKAIPEGMFIRLWDRTMGTPKPPNVQLLGEASKDAFKPISRTWVNDNANTNDLFNYWQLNQESQGQSMVVNDLVRGAKRTAGGKVTPAYQSLQDSDYLGKRLAYNEDGIVIDTDVSDRPNYLYNLPGKEREYPYLYSYPYQDGDASSRVVTRKNNAAKGIRNFTPASDFYSQGSQVVRRVVNGIPQEVIYDPNRDLQQAAKTEFWELRDALPSVPIGSYQVNEYGTVLVDEDGYPLEMIGYDKASKAVPNKYLPRSAQIANAGTRSFPGIENAPRNYEDYPVEYPYHFDPNNKGITPEYEFPDGMSYEEADRLGLVKPVFNNTRKRALDDRYQIPIPNDVGFVRVLPFEDPRTQAALAAQGLRLKQDSLWQQGQNGLGVLANYIKTFGTDEADYFLKVSKKGYSTPSIQRDYKIKPSRTAGIDSPQYAMFSDLKGSPSDDTARFWQENIPGVIPQGVVDGAYIPITMNPRNEQGKPPKKDALMTAIDGRIMKGKDIKFYGYAPLDLEYAMSHVDPRDMSRLLGEGLTEEQIKQKVLDNVLANTQIKLDGKMHPLTREATEPFFEATPTSKYYQASNNVAFRGANVNSPIVNDVIGLPSDEWVMEQMAKGNLNFSPENWVSDNERVTLRQREIYADPSIEPRDIVDAINIAQRKKNVIDALISNQSQRGFIPQVDNPNIVNAPLDSYLPSLGNSTDVNPQQILNWKLEPIPKSQWKTSSYDLSSLDPSQAVVENVLPAVPRQPRMSLAEQSRHLEDEIRRATIAHNQLIGVENSPEITITRTGNANQLESFLDAANSMGLKTLDSSSVALDNPSATVVGSLPFNQEQTVYENTKRLDAPYTVLSSRRQDTLLPSSRTSQLFTPVPTSNMRDLSREFVPFPEEVITTSQVVPQGNVVTPLPGSSESYIPENGLGLLGSDGGSIPGDYIPGSPRTFISSQVRNQPEEPRTSFRTSVNPVIEPETVMAGTKIPKWAIPASLGAAWLALAGYQRSRKEQEQRQKQSQSVNT